MFVKNCSRSLVLLATGLLTLGWAGCSRRTTTTTSASVASATPAADAAVADVRSTPPPQPSSVEVFPVPAAPKGANLEHVQIASAICAAGWQPTAKAPAIGCRSHPPFTSPEQRPDGKLPELASDAMSFCAIERVYRGAFSRAGASQAVVVFGECWEHADGFDSNAMSSPSVVLVEEVPGPSRWKVEAYEPGIHAGSCKTSRGASGRDVLLCDAALGAYGLGSMTFLFALDFGRSDRKAYTIARVFSDDVECMQIQGSGDALAKGLTSARVTRTTLTDVNHDGTADLVAEVERARVGPSAALKAKADADCTTSARPRLEAFLPKPQRHRLELVSKDGIFVPAPTSQKLLDGWTDETPRYGIEAAGPPTL